jgi:hypothetical protein
MSRELATIAGEIKRDWKTVNFAAAPYLSAMLVMDTIDRAYWNDSGRSIVGYLLGNATQWKGPVARRVKAELLAMLKAPRAATGREIVGVDVDTPGFSVEIIGAGGCGPRSR